MSLRLGTTWPHSTSGFSSDARGGIKGHEGLKGCTGQEVGRRGEGLNRLAKGHLSAK